MGQNTIQPFDNGKLKTRKVQALLDEAGVLPRRSSDRPSFLRPLRSAEALLNRVLRTAGRNPIVLRDNKHEDARVLNSALVFTPIGGGDFTVTSEINVVNGAYTLNGQMVALSDLVDCSNPGSWFDPVNDIDAGGIKMFVDDGQGGLLGRQIYFTNDLIAACIGGYTIVMEVLAGTDDCMLDVYSQNVDGSIYSEAGIQWDYIRAEFRQYLYAIPDGSSFLDETNPPTSDLPTGSPSTTVKVAITFASDHMAISVAGSAPRNVPSPGVDPSMTMFLFSTNSQHGDTSGRLRNFSIYEPVDDADLSTLSAA